MLSIVIPIFNEEESVEALYRELLPIIDKLDRESEIIFIDDGSTDGSLEILKSLEKTNNKVRIFSFRKNQGKSEALTLGFQKAKGDYVVTLDGDLQDKPSEIPKLLKKVKEGWDLVCGWRKNRKDTAFKVLSSKFFNYLTAVFWGLRLHDYNCGLKAYSKETAKSLSLYGGMHRFIPLLAYDQGFTVTEVAVGHDKRKYGKSKYGFSKIWKDLPDIFTMLFLSKYSKRPFHFFGAVGAVLIFTGIITLGYLSYLRLQGATIGNRPLLFFGMLLVISGFQVFFTGFMSDLIINISYKRDKEFLLKYSSEAQ